MKFNYEKFEKWEENTHIPEDVMKMVEIVSQQLDIPLGEETVSYRNRGGYEYAYAKGFSITHCTSSLADGPSEDMTPVFMRWLGGLGFEVVNSYGDNGLDSATNWHDTFWTKEVAYSPSRVDRDTFLEWDDEDDEDYYDDYDYEYEEY